MELLGQLSLDEDIGTGIAGDWEEAFDPGGDTYPDIVLRYIWYGTALQQCDITWKPLQMLVK